MKFFSRKLVIFSDILIVLITVLPTVDALDKIRLLPDDPRGIIGESLKMWCSINSTSGFKSSDLELYFELIGKHLKQVDLHFIQIVNLTTVELNYPSVPLRLNDALVICKLNSNRVNQTENRNSTLSDRQILRVGYRPFKPYIAKDYKVYNWDYFTFTWYINQTDPVFLSNYKAWYKSRFESEFTRCRKQHDNTCKITNALELVHPSGLLQFKVNGSNAVGEISSETERADLHYIIQPGKVANVTVSSTLSNGVVAEFYSPNKSHRLKYRISVACGNITWPIIVIKNLSSKGPLSWKIEHALPPFTKCHLAVSCLPFHNRHYWSDWSENVSFTSPEGLPLVGPQLCCFETELSNTGQRGIKIYFKNLTERQAQGEVVAYHIHFNPLTSGTQMNFSISKEKYVEPNAPFFSLDVDTEMSYTVSISAQTRAGRNISAVSFMPLLSQDELLPWPQNMTAIWYGSGIVIVSWLPMEPKLFDYTIVWCKGFSQCEKSVDWKITSNSSCRIQLPPDENYLSYRFGIAVSRVGGRSSGIKWLECIYNISAGASAPSAHVLNKTSSAVSFHIDASACPGGNNGYIYEYQVYYMKGENISFVRTPHQLNSSEWNVVIDHLEPDSVYYLHVVALTYSGPSEEKLMTIRTNPSGNLTNSQLSYIVIGSVVGIFFIALGVYSCCRWNKMQLLRFKRWVKLDITIPRKQTLDSRGSADGGHLSSSYTSLTKNQESLLLEQMKNSSDIKDEKEEVSTGARGTSGVVQDTRPVTEGDFVPLPLTVVSGPSERLLVISDDTSGCEIDHATGSAEDSKPMNGILLVSTGETQIQQIDGAALISQNVMHSSVAGSLENVATSSDGSDNVEDYSNVRIVQPSEHLESSEIYEDGYSLARPPAADDDITEEESDNDYSNAVLSDDLDYQLEANEAQQVLQSLVDNSSDAESAEDEEDSNNYSRASIIRRLQ